MANIENYIELTNQIFWDGYAEQLAKDDPAAFITELREFENLYNSTDNVRHNFSFGQGDHTNHA
jgi:hypothetical protein